MSSPIGPTRAMRAGVALAASIAFVDARAAPAIGGGAAPSTVIQKPIPYSEIGAPSGAYAGKAPKGWVMLVHGGAWDGVGSEYVAQLRPEARRFTRRGWATLNVDYRPGAQSVADVAAAYDRLRARLGAGGPVCVYGQSAGGHLVLMTATARASVDCVIAEGAPTNLPAFAYQTAFDAATGHQQTAGPQAVRDKATQAFGAQNLRFFSPLGSASRMRAATLMATATSDPLVPMAQMDALRAARPDKVTVMRLASESRPKAGSLFTHAYITAGARNRWEAAKSNLLAARAR